MISLARMQQQQNRQITLSKNFQAFINDQLQSLTKIQTKAQLNPRKTLRK